MKQCVLNKIAGNNLDGDIGYMDIEDVADVVRKSRFRMVLVTWREKMRETGYQLAEIWLFQEMLERVDQGRGGGMFWSLEKRDLKKARLDRGLGKDRDGGLKLWGKCPTCASTEKGA